jgi:hypothetical protein
MSGSEEKSAQRFSRLHSLPSHVRVARSICSIPLLSRSSCGRHLSSVSVSAPRLASTVCWFGSSLPSAPAQVLQRRWQAEPLHSPPRLPLSMRLPCGPTVLSGSLTCVCVHRPAEAVAPPMRRILAEPWSQAGYWAVRWTGRTGSCAACLPLWVRASGCVWRLVRCYGRQRVLR